MARNQPDAKRQLDYIFLEVLSAMIKDVVKTSAASAEQVIKLSSGFLTEKAQRAVKQFHKLYFASATVEQSKADVNQDVDRLFDAIQDEVSQGKSETEIAASVAEDAALKEARLTLSGVQKELETLIRLDAGIREKLVPVLTCMQFEDMMRQRLEHVEIAWRAIVGGLGPDEILDVEMVALETETNLSSVDERAQFYRIVLKKEPPADGMDAGGILFGDVI